LCYKLSPLAIAPGQRLFTALLNQLTFTAQPPPRHFHVVDPEPRGHRRTQARCLTHDTGNILDRTTGPTHHVVVIIPDPALIQRGPPPRFDPPRQPDPNQGREHVIDGLRRDRAQFASNVPGYPLGIHMPQLVQSLEHGDPLRRHPKPGGPQKFRWILGLHAIQGNMPPGSDQLFWN
jgi:hypothetical protein